jgi:hypothetical protein
MANKAQITARISEKLTEWTTTLSDSLHEQAWFQELRGKWDELDPQSKIYLKFAALGALGLSIIVLVLSAVWRVHGLKTEYEEKTQLLNTIQNANDEIRRLKDSIPLEARRGDAGESKIPGDAEGGSLAYFQSLASTHGIGSGNLSIRSEKPGTSNEYSKEILLELSMKHINVKQLVRFAYALENGKRPVKLRNLAINTQADSSGYLDATLALSAFTPTPSSP